MNFIFSDIVHILCSPCNVKKPKTTGNLSKKAETNAVQTVFDNVLYHVCALLTVALHESGTRKILSLSVTIYNKKLSSQCNMTAQIEPVQDKKKVFNVSCILNSLPAEIGSGTLPPR